MILDFFKQRKFVKFTPPRTDLHSHLLPGLDDGVKTMSEAIEVIGNFYNLGYRKMVTTPHIMSDYYPNDEHNINNTLAEVRSELRKKGIKVDLHAAAEYYLDEALIEKLENNEPLLTFGGKFLLFETAFMNEPVFLKEAVFKMSANGYKPVYAHPERYLYLMRKPALVKELLNMNVFFQLNILSLRNYYSKEVRKFAEKLLKMRAIHFIGSDCHNIRQFNSLKLALESRELSRLSAMRFFNDKLAF